MTDINRDRYNVIIDELIRLDDLESDTGDASLIMVIRPLISGYTTSDFLKNLATASVSVRSAN